MKPSDYKSSPEDSGIYISAETQKKEAQKKTRHFRTHLIYFIDHKVVNKKDNVFTGNTGNFFSCKNFIKNTGKLIQEIPCKYFFFPVLILVFF